MNKKKSSITPSLLISDFTRIQEVFNEKGWPIDDTFGDPVFDNFCKMLTSLNKEQYDLVLSLTKDFLWVRDTEYIPHFEKVFLRFTESYSFSRGKNLMFCPLLPEIDFGKSKSSIMLLYLIKARLQAIKTKYSDFKISLADSPNSINVDAIKNKFTLCLIDDFIGTGETALGAIEYFEKNGISRSQIVIISLVGMQEGIERLNENGCCVYSDVICEKGIAKHDNDEEVRIMKSIEDKIKIKDEFRFGYGASEALVRMMRTPNNTFPVYWCKKNNKHAPFPR